MEPSQEWMEVSEKATLLMLDMVEEFFRVEWSGNPEIQREICRKDNWVKCVEACCRRIEYSGAQNISGSCTGQIGGSHTHDIGGVRARDFSSMRGSECGGVQANYCDGVRENDSGKLNTNDIDKLPSDCDRRHKNGIDEGKGNYCVAHMNDHGVQISNHNNSGAPANDFTGVRIKEEKMELGSKESGELWTGDENSDPFGNSEVFIKEGSVEVCIEECEEPYSLFLDSMDVGRDYKTTYRECGKAFNDHNQKSNSMKKLLHCDYCTKVFNHRSDLIRHHLSHLGVKRFQCPDCGRFFSQKGHLNKHSLLHTGIKYECRDCGRFFAQKGHLTEHARVHSGVKDFSCLECGERFSRKGNLVRHMQSHTGEKKFQCPDCGKKFGQKSHLTEHLQTHTNSCRYKCGECSKLFTRKNNLGRHLKDVHKITFM